MNEEKVAFEALQKKLERKRALAQPPAASGRFEQTSEDNGEDDAGSAIEWIAQSRNATLHRHRG
jgi:hypothetical protein